MLGACMSAQAATNEKYIGRVKVAEGDVFVISDGISTRATLPAGELG